MHPGFELWSVQIDVGQFVGKGVALTIGMMVRIDADEFGSFLEEGHPRKLIVKWRVSDDDAELLCYSLHWDGRSLDPETFDEFGSLGSCTFDVGHGQRLTGARRTNCSA